MLLECLTRYAYYHIVLVRFSDTSGELGQAMVRILARRNPAKITMARRNEPVDAYEKKVRLRLFSTQIQARLKLCSPA